MSGRDAIVAAARAWIGTPYRHQAALRGVGCDCLGLLRGVWRDVLLFRWRAHLPAKHAGILTGPATMVHAQEGAAVAEVALNGWWRRRADYGFELDL